MKSPGTELPEGAEVAERRHEVREELRAAFNEMDGGNFVEPTDDEFARAVNERALKHVTG